MPSPGHGDYLIKSFDFEYFCYYYHPCLHTYFSWMLYLGPFTASVNTHWLGVHRDRRLYRHFPLNEMEIVLCVLVFFPISPCGRRQLLAFLYDFSFLFVKLLFNGIFLMFWLSDGVMDYTLCFIYICAHFSCYFTPISCTSHHPLHLGHSRPIWRKFCQLSDYGENVPNFSHMMTLWCEERFQLLRSVVLQMNGITDIAYC